MFLVLFLGLLVLVLEVEDVKLQVGHLHPGGLLQGVPPRLYELFGQGLYGAPVICAILKDL